MNEIQTTAFPPRGKTTIDEYIEALIHNTADGLQYWHVDLTGKRKPRYYYNAGLHRVYITCEWMTPEESQFSLHMASHDGSGRESLIASEHIPHDQPSPLRELWTILQDHIVEEDDFDVLGYAKLYVMESQRQKQLDELCHILVLASEDIVELFRSKDP